MMGKQKEGYGNIKVSQFCFRDKIQFEGRGIPVLTSIAAIVVATAGIMFAFQVLGISRQERRRSHEQATQQDIDRYVRSGRDYPAGYHRRFHGLRKVFQEDI
jgi:hypothetical protein